MKKQEIKKALFEEQDLDLVITLLGIKKLEDEFKLPLEQIIDDFKIPYTSFERLGRILSRKSLDYLPEKTQLKLRRIKTSLYQIKDRNIIIEISDIDDDIDLDFEV